MNRIILSFIIPIYNTDLHLMNKCVGSIRAKSSIEYEIIIVDDGSKKEISDECDKILSTAENIKVYHQDNKGVSAARNIGIENARGEYIIFVDPDDHIGGNVYEFFEQLNGKKVDIFIFDYTNEFSNGAKKLVELSENECALNKFKLIDNTLFGIDYQPDFSAGSIWGKAFRREFLRENKLLFHCELRKAQDRVYMAYAYSKAKKIKYHKINSYFYYQNMDSVCHSYSKDATKRSLAFYKVINDFIDESSFVENKIKVKNRIKILLYYETVYLEYFNYLNFEPWMQKRQGAKEFYKRFEVKQASKNLTMSDFINFKAKLKFIMIKFKLLFILYFFVSHTQKIRRN